MNDDPWLREGFRAMRRRDAGAVQGFVCVLDLRPARPGMQSHPTGRIVPCAALLAFVAFLAGSWFTLCPAHPLQLDAAAIQLAAWESPTAFLLAADFQTTPPN